jgi:hypothetical protein
MQVGRSEDAEPRLAGGELWRPQSGPQSLLSKPSIIIQDRHDDDQCRRAAAAAASALDVMALLEAPVGLISTTRRGVHTMATEKGGAR